MKINLDTNKALNIGAGTLLSAVTVLCGISMVGSVERIQQQRDEAKEYVLKNAPDKYQEILNRETYFDWRDEAKTIQDSLKLDSIAKTNYALGMQAVRDSLANANKK